MEESDESAGVVPELYFLIAKFLSGGPLKETAKTLLNELESVEVLPRRTDWLGAHHAQSYHELAAQYREVPWHRLAAVCARALRLASAPGPAPRAGALPPSGAEAGPGAGPVGVRARLSLLSEALVRGAARYASHRADHTLVRGVLRRELGSGPCCAAGGGGGRALLQARALRALRLQRRTLGHLSAVYCLAVDGAGRCVVTGADDLLVKVWSGRDGRLLSTLRGAAAEITDVALSADGALLAAGSVERLVRVWCMSSGSPVAVLHAHGGTVTAVCWAPPAHRDVRWLASTSTDGSVAFWTCSAAGQFLSQPVQYVERMRPGACHMVCAAWSRGGAFLAAGSADHHVRVYQVDGAAPTRVLEVAVHADAVDSLSWAHRGLRFVSGSKDGTAALWTFHATQWRHHMLRCAPLEGGPEPALGADGKRLRVTMVCWECSDRLVLTACSDRSVRVWCARSARQQRALRAHADEAYVLEPHPFLEGVVLSAGHDGQLLVWDAVSGDVLSRHTNRIHGQGDGALFDAKWCADGVSVAACDAHGHLLLLGLGAGHRLLAELPAELFFHTDYRPLVRDALGGALDEQTETPPHLLPPPFLVDVEGAPHPPPAQRLVPGREALPHSQLVPAAHARAGYDAQRSRIDVMIEALAAERTPPAELAALGLPGGPVAQGPWRGEGVRHTAGAWHSAEAPAPHNTRPIVQPIARAHRERIERCSAELNAMELSWYRRELRRRPVMISTACDGSAGPRRKPGRRPARAAAPGRARTRPQQPAAAANVRTRRPTPFEFSGSSASVSSGASASASGSGSDTSDESVRLSASERSEGSARPRPRRPGPRPRARPRPGPRPRARPRPPRAGPGPRAARDRRSDHTTDTDTDTSISYSDSPSSASSASSQYSDWEAGAALAPPHRARRRPQPAQRYSPSAAAVRRAAGPGAAAPGPGPAGAAPGPAAPGPEADAYRPCEWLSAVWPRKAPYHPQMGDECMYFRLGHQRYFEAVSEKDLYPVSARDRPWDRALVHDCESVKVVGIKYVIKPPRVVCLRLACTPDPEAGEAGSRSRALTVRYHDMPDVIDFLVLRQQYEAATARHWAKGDRFRCMIDDSWWTGVVLERSPAGPSPRGPSSVECAACASCAAGAAACRRGAAHFLSLRVRWDNGEVERLSPWDLEPIDPDRLPAEPGGSVCVLPGELCAVLYACAPRDWPPDGERARACGAIAAHVAQVMSLSAAEPFVSPVDLQQYPAYARVVPYPVDLDTIRARCENMFYRRVAAVQCDARHLASNAERFNEPHSPIVRQARLVTDLLLHIISNWRSVDVVSKYHELAAAYHSSDDEPLAAQGRRVRGGGRGGGGAGGGAGAAAGWVSSCRAVLRALVAAPDAAPFRQPVSAEQAPDYHLVVSRPLDLGAVERRLAGSSGAAGYGSAQEVAADVRRVFTNSRLYNTNKRSRIYSMTVRLSALFESLWARHVASPRPRGASPPHAAPGSPPPRDTRRARPRRGRRRTRRPRRDTGEASPGAGASASSECEPLAAASRRARTRGEAHRGRGEDSWDSDAPLGAHRKGKGVGKKSKSSPAPGPARSPSPAPSPSPEPGTSYTQPYTDACSPPPAVHNGVHSSGGGSSGGASSVGGSSCSRLVVVEHELADDEQLTYDSDDTHASQHNQGYARARAGRKRRRARSPAPRADAHRTKRTRERFTDVSSSSSSPSPTPPPRSPRGGGGVEDGGGGGGGGGRYESDHSYKPRYSTDDDAPLHIYRQLHSPAPGERGGGGGGGRGAADQAGPSGSQCARRGAGGSGGVGVMLRTRGSPRRYNEDSEEDSMAAISKRLPQHNRTQRHRHDIDTRRQRHATGVRGSVSHAHADHDYYSGQHAHAHAGHAAHGPAAHAHAAHAHAAHAADPHAHAYPPANGSGSGSSAVDVSASGSGVSAGLSAGAVSISSRGRVRKLTAKAQGLLRE